MKKFFFLLLSVAMAVPSPLHAKSAGQTGFSFLKFTSFARSAAMSEATTGTVGDAMVVYSNPAGLAHFSEREIALSHMSHFEDVSSSNFTAVIPTRRGGWGFHVGVLDVGGVTKTKFDSSNSDRFVETGEVTAGDQFVSVSWGRRQTMNVAWGLGVKIVQETLDNESALAVLGDAGAIYRIDRQWRVAAVVQNVGGTSQFLSEKVSPPTRGRAAVYWAPERWIQWEVDGVYNVGGDTELLVGGETNWRRIGFFRAGYRYTFEDADLGGASGVSLGGGVQVAGLRLDYAYLPFGDLGESHRFSFTWRFGEGGKK